LTSIEEKTGTSYTVIIWPAVIQQSILPRPSNLIEELQKRRIYCNGNAN